MRGNIWTLGKLYNELRTCRFVQLCYIPLIKTYPLVFIHRSRSLLVTYLKIEISCIMFLVSEE